MMFQSNVHEPYLIKLWIVTALGATMGNTWKRLGTALLQDVVMCLGVSNNYHYVHIHDDIYCATRGAN